jgi:hypothetical protein
VLVQPDRAAPRRPLPPNVTTTDWLPVADRGAALAVPAPDITAGTLERLVTDPALTDAAREVAAEIAAMPAPGELVEPLLDGVRSAS